MDVFLNVENEHKILSEALVFRDATFWKEAVNDEMGSMISINIWFLVEFLPWPKPIKSKWVSRIKCNVNSMPQTFKA